MTHPITPDLTDLPQDIRSFIGEAGVYDHTYSGDTSVWLIQKPTEFFIKRGHKNQLQREAILTYYFHEKQLGPEVILYLSEAEDWLVTKRLTGRDCTDPMYLSQPERLCDRLSSELRRLHEIDPRDCPLKNQSGYLLDKAEKHFREGYFDHRPFPSDWGFLTPESAYQVIQHNKHQLQNNSLLHGDYCLPNIILDDWRLSGYIDLDTGGIGDRMYDVFWGAWTLRHNLKTDQYRERFFDGYGRDHIELEKIELIRAIVSLG
ncbi:MAG TPA: aminoglycoside 3'-phosphotransferase [Tissierellia bacterium]|nr:aminoglycoside 3'-phosphotransferase [Tissierellia bacterium]